MRVHRPWFEIVFVFVFDGTENMSFVNDFTICYFNKLRHFIHFKKHLGSP